MKETPRMIRIREALTLLNRRIERLNEELNNAMPEIVVITEINLCLEALMNLKAEYKYLEEEQYENIE